jgi:cytochrome c556
MRKLVLAISALALASSAVLADPIADRRAIMKSNGKAAGALVAIVKTEQPFDASVVLAALTTLSGNAKKIDVAALFPPGSDKGGETAASPKIWEDLPGFQAKVEKFKADTAAAAAAPAQDMDALKAQLDTIGKNCGGCHETFRIKKPQQQ